MLNTIIIMSSYPSTRRKLFGYCSTTTQLPVGLKKAHEYSSYTYGCLFKFTAIIIHTNHVEPQDTTHVAGDNNLTSGVYSHSTKAKQILIILT